MQTTQTFAEFSAALRANGYQPKAPTSLAQQIDSAVVAAGTCAACGCQHLAYRPFSQPTLRRRNGELGRSYRALAVCTACGDYQEF